MSMTSGLAALRLALVLPVCGFLACDTTEVSDTKAPTAPAEARPIDRAELAAEAQTEAAPPTEQAPAPEPEPEAEPEPVSYGHADLDPNNDDVLGPPPPMDDCEEQLEAAEIRYKSARIGVGKKRDGVYTCGAKQVVRIKRGPGKIEYSSNPLLTCQMAVAFADFERIAQEEALEHLGSKIKSIRHLGTFNCREMALYDLISEHSFANGIDLAEFEFQNGDKATVLKHFQPDVEDPEDPKTRFLRSLANRLYDEEVFSVVVTPYFDRAHRNHIHVDLARYRVDGSRP
jgi:hypothetical protein